MQWISFIDKWPTKTGNYYVSWNLKKPRVRKLIVDKCGPWTRLNFGISKDWRDCLEAVPTHWSYVEG